MSGLEEDRKAIRTTLKAAGWQVSDRGKLSDERGYMEHKTSSGLLLEIQEGTNEEKDRFIFFYLSPGAAQGVHLNVHFKDDPTVRDGVLKYIGDHKDDFSPETYKDHLRKLLKLGPEILVDVEDDLIPLADDLESLP
jgi:hypothetical protein